MRIFSFIGQRKILSYLPMRVSTILVVDDEEAVREALSLVLGKAGYTVKTAANGQSGLELLQQGPLPDVILLDLMMPVMTGFEVLAALRMQPAWSAIPVVVLTAAVGDSAENLHVAAALRKPFALSDVQASIHIALASKRSQEDETR